MIKSNIDYIVEKLKHYKLEYLIEVILLQSNWGLKQNKIKIARK